MYDERTELSTNEKVVYIYDGSFEGFLCCVFNFYYNRLKPVEIVSEAEYNPSFYAPFYVETDFEKAYRVRHAIESQLGYSNLDFLQECMLTCLAQKEMYMLKYVVKGFKIGSRIFDLQGDEDVGTLVKAHRRLENERHHYMGWVRFYKAGNVYVSRIKPQNQVLPLLSWHFTQRFSGQAFIIYDENYKQALIYYGNSYKIVYIDNIELPPVSEDEKQMQRLWKAFYDSIAIKERYNPKCRMSFMPKRLWDNLPEMQGEK